MSIDQSASIRNSVTLRQVAERAGVARGTVSNVLNHPDRVSGRLTERVRSAMEELSFVRNETARQLRSGRSSNLALSLIDTWNPYFNDVARGIEDFIYGQGQTLSVSTSAFDRERERINLAMFEERRVAGVLAVPIGTESIDQIASMRERGLACVIVDRDAEGRQVPSISVDEELGGRLAGQHLLERGRTKIAFCGNPAVHIHARKRLAGLRHAVAGRGEVEHISVNGLTVAAGLEAGQIILDASAKARPHAVFAVNDLLAIGLLQAFSRAKVVVPGDIAIVGFDNIEFAAQVAVPLTTVHQPAYDLGHAVAKLLHEEIESNALHEPQQVVFTPHLVVREST